MSTEKLPLLIIFRREGREAEDELRIAWHGEEALEIAKSMLNRRAFLLAGDALLVMWDQSATEALSRVKTSLAGASRTADDLRKNVAHAADVIGG